MATIPKHTEQLFDVYWDGPHKLDELEGTDPNCVLYMICGTHGLYGRNVPIYIGKTGRNIEQRMKEHAWWLDEEPDTPTVYVASIGPFESWEARDAIEEYLLPDEATIGAIETLLIYVHQPVFNTRNKLSAPLSTYLRVFNTGRRSTLYAEVSGLYWIGHGPQSNRSGV